MTLWQDARDGRLLGATHYYEEPSWLPDSSGALLFEETNALTAQVVAAGVGADHNHDQAVVSRLGHQARQRGVLEADRRR